MKNIFVYLFTLVLVMTCSSSSAQVSDTLHHYKTVKDTFTRHAPRGHSVHDTVPDSKAVKALKSRLTRQMRDSLTPRKFRSVDSLYKLKALSRKHGDSLHKLYKLDHLKADSLKRIHGLYRKSDSLYKHRVYQTYKHDSLRQKLYLVHMQADSLKKRYKAYYKSDSLYKQKVYQTYKQDSLKRKLYLVGMQADSLKKRYKAYHKSDSLYKHRLYQTYKQDSLNKYRKLYTVKLDSLKRKIYLQNIKTDSQRIKKYLELKKIQEQKFYTDSLRGRSVYRTRELSMEITCRPGDTVYINNSYKKVVINIKPSQKLRLSTLINYKEALNERDDEILKKMGIALSRTNNKVTAAINGAKQPGLKDNEPSYDVVTMETNVKRSLSIELPSNAVIVVNTKYTETNIENTVTSLKADIYNGKLEMKNADDVIIKSNYGTIKTGNIKNARLHLSSTYFKASNIDVMSVISTASTIKLNNCKTMDMTSNGDNYDIEKAVSISGNKNFGKLNIEDLKEQLVLTGANANVTIDNLGYEAPFVKIDNKYADLKLPLYNQPNYAVYYEGSYKDVNKLSAATQARNGKSAVAGRLPAMGDTLAGMGSLNKTDKTKFEAVAGDITGRHTKVDIVCQYCNVVFN